MDDDGWFLNGLEREADALRSLDHPAIPDYVDHFHRATEDGGRRYYLVQEYVPGKSLQTLIVTIACSPSTTRCDLWALPE